METKHSATPWFCDGGAFITIRAKKENETIHIADVYGDTEQHERGNRQNISDEECEANAYLISAAPDLLEACKMALTLIAKHDGCSRSNYEIYDVSQQIESAIAKAEGR